MGKCGGVRVRLELDLGAYSQRGARQSDCPARFCVGSSIPSPHLLPLPSVLSLPSPALFPSLRTVLLKFS